MSIKRERIVDDPSFSDLIGKPSLLASEDRGAYDGLRAAIERQINPQNIFDEMRVQDITEKFWEEQRLKRQQLALIQSAKVESLASLLSPHYGEDLDAALETARNYYSGDQQRMRPAQKAMERLGITNEQVEANGMRIRSLELLAFDRMISNRESPRYRLIKDHERRQKKTEKAKRRTPVNDN